MQVTRRRMIGSLLAAPLAWPVAAQMPAGARAASQFAIDKCNLICRAVSLTQNFAVYVGDVPAAEARLIGNQRQIIYNDRWLRQAELSQQQGVPVLVVLAHEIGHHLNGHTLDVVPSDVQGAPRFRMREELEADVFAGGIIARLRYPYEAGLPAFNGAAPAATVDHPSRAERLSYFIGGWKAVPTGAVCPGAPNSGAGNVRIINLFSQTQTPNGLRPILSQWRNERPGIWREFQENGQEFSIFREMFRDPCGRIFLFDESRGLWVRLLASPTGGYGFGEFGLPQGVGEGFPTVIPTDWHPLDRTIEGRYNPNTICRPR